MKRKIDTPKNDKKITHLSVAKCNCETNNICETRTVTRESVNKGKRFYSCDNVGGCNYFEWEEDFLKRITMTKSSKPRRAPTCGHCKQQGHTKRGCPQLKK